MVLTRITSIPSWRPSGASIWWYGLSYSLGFLNAHIFLRRNRVGLGFSEQEVHDLTLFLVVGVLMGGRSLVVFNNEWAFYREHLTLIPAIWLGGLGTHGLILGGGAGVVGWCLLHRKPVQPVLDVLAVAAALIMGCGRIGNFIDGQIVGSVTGVPVGRPVSRGRRLPTSRRALRVPQWRRRSSVITPPDDGLTKTWSGERAEGIPDRGRITMADSRRVSRSPSDDL